MKKTILSIIIVTVLIASITACGEEEEQPKNQSVTITGLFNNNSSATVKGYLTDTEWTGVANKIKTAINKIFNEIMETAQNNWKIAFSGGNVIIIVEKTNAYENWKTIGDSKTIYLNYDSLDKTDLHEIMANSISSMGQGQTGND